MAIIDIYCERTAAGLLNEPLNALTNLAFIAAAGVVFWRFSRQHRGWRAEWDYLLLIVLLFAIGVGSGLWHLFAQRWALLADVLPIIGFIWLFIISFCRRVMGASYLATALWFAAFIALGFVIATLLPRGALNGSGGYLAPWTALLAMTAYLYRQRWPGHRYFASAAALFALSLTFRSVDNALCSTIAFGTHFLWHLCNALVLFWLLLGLRQASDARR